MMANKWQMQEMADKHDSERQRGFGSRLSDGKTFAILELLLRLKI